MLTFNLKKEWYEKIASGEKRIEYREVKPYWTKRIEKEVSLYNGTMVWGENDLKKYPPHQMARLRINCALRLGYGKNYMTAKIMKVEVVDGKDTDLKIDKPVYAIHLDEVKEVEK